MKSTRIVTDVRCDICKSLMDPDSDRLGQWFSQGEVAFCPNCYEWASGWVVVILTALKDLQKDYDA